MENHEVYDAIIVFETDFQKSIIDIIINNYYKKKYVLLIDARNFSVKFEGRVYNINLNGFKRTSSSVGDLIRFPHLYTKELLCTVFPGIGCRMFPSIISYETLVLIDDGSGTPAILKNGIFLNTIKLKIRFLYASFILYLLKKRPLKYTKPLMKCITKYYSIYPFVKNDFSEFTKGIDIVYIDYFKQYKFNIILKGQAGFVSSGLPTDKNPLLSNIYHNYNVAPIYYPHPHENVSKIESSLIKEMIFPKVILEQYFMSNGIPEILFGEPSTVFINLRLSGYQGIINIFYKQSFKDTSYYEIFDKLGINMICIK